VLDSDSEDLTAVYIA